MTLEDISKRILFHNSVDVWIEYCEEAGRDWRDTDGYGKFIKYLLDSSPNMKSFNLCAHESGDTRLDRKEFAERLAYLKRTSPEYATYTLRLNGKMIETIRSFS